MLTYSHVCLNLLLQVHGSAASLTGSRVCASSLTSAFLGLNFLQYCAHLSLAASIKNYVSSGMLGLDKLCRKARRT